ncbi:hypothetical protein [Pendulispora albinea]|uniref:CopG family transcriptional regulator n=1 Tax=Pendulispora albinea TaxID=2741071 RepID=A0ABZ2M2B8_9BACT
MGAARKVQATALREIADWIEATGDDLSDGVAHMVDDMLDLIDHEEAVRDWREREARGEKTISSAEARKILGF